MMFWDQKGTKLLQKIRTTIKIVALTSLKNGFFESNTPNLDSVI
jgi:hypothetical protein